MDYCNLFIQINTYSLCARSLDCFCQLHINFALYSQVNFCVTNTHTAHIPWHINLLEPEFYI